MSGEYSLEPAKDFMIQSTSLSKITNQGNGVVLFFIPDCVNIASKREINSFISLYENLLDLGFELIGVTSQCTNYMLIEFKKDNNIEFFMINDVHYDISRLYNVFSDFSNKPLRRTFIIDSEMRILKKFTNIEPLNHATIVYEWIKNYLNKNNNLHHGSTQMGEIGH